MKLYYGNGACSLAPHIVLREAGYDFQVESVDLGSRKTKSGADFLSINPKGYVPALVLDDGELLTEAAVILQYLADQKPDSKLAPQRGTIERLRLEETLHFIATELHKSFSPLFSSQLSAEAKRFFRDRISTRFNLIEKQLADGRSYLTGENFSIADPYLFVMLGWAKYHEIDMTPWPRLSEYRERVKMRSAVRDAMKAETANA